MSQRTRPKNVIRQLAPGEPVPPGAPGRYRDGRGYVRLRWKIAPNEYVEVYEHRLMMGVPDADVHHRDENKGNNDPGNLQVLDRAAHAREHGAHSSARSKRITQWAGMRSQAAFNKRQSRLRREREHQEFLSRIRDLYRSGLSTIEVGRVVGRDPSRISVFLSRMGVTTRRQADYLPTIDRDAIRRWHAEGVRASEMMRRLGVGRKRLYQVFEELGLPRFRSGNPTSRPHDPMAAAMPAGKEL